MRSAGHEECRTGGEKDRKSAGQEEYMRERMEDKWV